MSKCESCNNICFEGASLDYPYPHVWCSKGHWEGSYKYEDEKEDTWRDCEDFRIRDK